MQGTTCQQDCTGLDCGRDPVCGASCGTCPPEQICTAGACGAIDASMGKLYGFVVALDPDEPDPDLSQAPTVGGALVRSTDLSTKAFADGYYELLVPPGEHQLSARAPGYLEGTATCSVDAGGHSECILPVYEELEADVVEGGCGCGGSAPAGLLALLALGLFFRRKRV
jgi:MYXO-CTERM domain-containing protein